MNLPIRLLAALAAFAPSMLLAQTSPTANPDLPAPASGAMANTHESSAIQAALGDNSDGVEASLARLLAARSQPDAAGSMAWHTGMGLQLMQVVRQTPQAGNGRSTILTDLAHRAESHLKQADALATTPAQRANAQALLGLLNERFLGNMSAAISYYRAAVSLDPAHTMAKSAGDRLERAEARFRQRRAERGVAP